jgi:hypothetical protein
MRINIRWGTAVLKAVDRGGFLQLCFGQEVTNGFSQLVGRW